jgi:hypothetical protein
MALCAMAGGRLWFSDGLSEFRGDVVSRDQQSGMGMKPGVCSQDAVGLIGGNRHSPGVKLVH